MHLFKYVAIATIFSAALISNGAVTSAAAVPSFVQQSLQPLYSYFNYSQPSGRVGSRQLLFGMSCNECKSVASVAICVAGAGCCAACTGTTGQPTLCCAACNFIGSIVGSGDTPSNICAYMHYCNRLEELSQLAPDWFAQSEEIDQFWIILMANQTGTALKDFEAVKQLQANASKFTLLE